ncbi:DUF5590 domain-containing protein [Listeria sp. PSOL-1]|uniref:cell wall elongation regulator TseB-like domain-containing protein n=1 Tax=Listeria sp. PSOL-1 TaxID=1844999 RepID=UPI0013CFA5B2|nr:DUF5590 domain-containing protein [Listeria sp. PSOL-1]
MREFILHRKKKGRKIGLWILAIISVVILLLLAFFLYARSAERPVQEAKKEALARISGSVDLKDQGKFYLYTGIKSTYYVLTGKNKENKEIIIWVPKKKSDKIYVKYASDGISAQKARRIVEAAKKPKKILNVTLGMEGDLPLYEVSYLDKYNRLNYYDMTFRDGEWLREIENL